MLRARALQDDTGGLQAFIPLAFHPDNNQMRKLPAPSAIETLRVHAVARLMLDNVPHIKAFWIATGVETAQLALWFGADDLDGTVQEEHIYHMAGSKTPEGDDDQGDPPPHPRGRPRAVRARHALQRRSPARTPSWTAPSAWSAHRSAGHPRLRIAWISICSLKSRNRASANGSRSRSATSVSRTTRWTTRIAAAKAALGERARHPRPSLPARRGHQVRRLHRRLAEAGEGGGCCRQERRPGIHRVLRRALHGRERRHPARAAPEGDPSRPGRRLFDGRHGRRRSARDRPGASLPAWASTSAPSSRSPTSIRRRRSKRSSASTAASSARPPTPRRS